MCLLCVLPQLVSASKIFEDRLLYHGLTAEFPDFEAVSHLVIDAVEFYNDRWEAAFKQQQQVRTTYVMYFKS